MTTTDASAEPIVPLGSSLDDLPSKKKNRGGGDEEEEENGKDEEEEEGPPSPSPSSSAPLVRAGALPESSKSVTSRPDLPSVSATAVLGESASMPEGSETCGGYDFNRTLRGSGVGVGGVGGGVGGKVEEEDVLAGLVRAMRNTGFQATNLGLAVEEINRMRAWRLSDVPFREGIDDEDLRDPSSRSKIRARIFLAYTSNQISCGQREVIRFLVEHRMVDVLVTTAGGVEEDIIKCFEPTYMGDFKLRGKDLRRRGINRIGNLLVPNNNYCKFEDWFAPLLVKMHDEQDARWVRWAEDVANGKRNHDGTLPDKFSWTPSAVIERMGREIDDGASVLCWAARNSIPVFCPALTDGSVGDMLYFHSYKRPGLALDIAADIRRINDLSVRSKSAGMIVLGGGLAKHHACNACLMRNGADFAVYVNTAAEYDGSDSGASPDEAVSWGKIRADARPVKVCCDATIAFPLIVSQTFARDVEGWKRDVEGCVCWPEEDGE